MTIEFKTSKKDFTIAFATPKDCALIHQFILELARYEKLEDQVVATIEGLHESIFIKKQAQVLIGYYKNEPVSFALFFYNYSTFLGKANLYLEDLYVKEEHRSKGYGKAMFACLANIAQQNNCERLDWWCLDWNKPSINFYLKLGAIAMDEWTVYRLQGEQLKNLANAL